MTIDPKDMKFSIIKNRGDPKSATTLSGHRVEKEENVICEDPWDVNVPRRMIQIKCMDYHMEHFVYLDPAKPGEKSSWFAWCTCGAPAVIIGMENPTLVCFFHTQFSRHVTGDGREWK